MTLQSERKYARVTLKPITKILRNSYTLHDVKNRRPKAIPINVIQMDRSDPDDRNDQSQNNVRNIKGGRSINNNISNNTKNHNSVRGQQNNRAEQ